MSSGLKMQKKRKSVMRNHLVDSLVPKKESRSNKGTDVGCRRKKKGGEEEQAGCSRHGYHLVRGKMEHGMEDFLVAEKRKLDGHVLNLYAIFDGHSGRHVAQYLQSHLFDNILNQPDFWRAPKKAVRRAYKMTDDEILKDVVDGQKCTRGGSTAVTAILVDDKILIVGNVGDSRAVLCRNGMATQMTVDHEPEKEKEAVESRGGSVIQKPGNVARVDGQLAMSRAFGDAKVKDHISSEPDLKVVTIDPVDSDFMFWQVMGCGR